MFPGTRFPDPLSGSKDWANAGTPIVVATMTIPMSFFMTRSIVVLGDGRCHHLPRSVRHNAGADV
jgi:hypothetical protein